MNEWKIKLIALVAIFLACFIVDMKLRGFSRETKVDETTEVLCIGEVITLDAGRATGEPPNNWTWNIDGQIATMRILSGRFKGEEVYAKNIFIGEYSDRVLKPGDRLYLSIPSANNKIIGTQLVSLGEYMRISFLLYLATAFLALMVIIGGSKGIRAAMSLVVSVVFIAAFLIPMFLKGYNPVWSAILIATVNSILTFMLVGGMTKKSLAGVLGTVGGLLTAALLASFSSYILRFTGLDVTFGFLNVGKRLWLSGDTIGWDLRGLLVAGMILGASGAIMDASMAVASAIDEVKKASPKTGIRGCIRAGLNVGKDEMGTMANTLIFAYIGADITLAMLPLVQFGDMGHAYPFTRVISSEAASAEIVQALTGTIGLIMAIPITALMAGFLIGRTHGTSTEISTLASGNMKRQWWLPVALLVITLGTHITHSATRHTSAAQTEASFVSEYARAKILEEAEPIEIPSEFGYARESARSKILKVKLLGGAHRGQEVLVRNVVDPNQTPLLANKDFASGDEVILKVESTSEGIHRAILHNLSRDGYLLYLAGLFVLVMVMVGRFQGMRTVIALCISITAVFKGLIPLIMAGYDPVLAVIGVSGFIVLTSLVIITGFNRKAGAATIGILGGVVVATLVVLYADHKLHFTGISTSRSVVVAQFTVSHNLDFRKILMAGIIMGLLGTAMDAAMAVASAVREVRRANPKMTVAQLTSAGMNVGTDVLGTMANTLLFAYLGLRLMLLMTLAGTSILSINKVEMMSMETVSAEFLRLLAGSIGLVLTIPITAVTAASWDKVTNFLGLRGRSA